MYIPQTLMRKRNRAARRFFAGPGFFPLVGLASRPEFSYFLPENNLHDHFLFRTNREIRIAPQHCPHFVSHLPYFAKERLKNADSSKNFCLYSSIISDS